MYLADLHIHSRYSRATSPEGDAPHLDRSAREKGIGLVGTGDFTHPAWRAELRASLLPAEDGLYRLREELQLPADAADAAETRFVISGEISTIYKKNGKTRKVHSVILLPSLEAAEKVSVRLEAIGNIHSDGRPILGLDCRDLLDLTLSACPDAMFIPAHIWTPHFSLFGAFSGFDTIEECFGDLTGEIHALETGLSSDPPMNWRISALDRFTLVSNSDAHSPTKLGREANMIEAACSYPALKRAVETGEGFSGTIEFFPEEGKYHLDGHRGCGVCMTPEEAEAVDGRCPVCGKRLTVGVQHRVHALADRPEGFVPAGAKPFERLVPLAEVVAASMGAPAAGTRVQQTVETMRRTLGPEFQILREVPIDEIAHAAGLCVAEGVRRVREGRVERAGGFDGEYGRITLLTADERKELMGQMSLLGAGAVPIKKPAARSAPQKTVRAGGTDDPAPAEEASGKAGGDGLNEAQRGAVFSDAPALAVIAGPGTGKTKTLVARIAHLVEDCGAHPGTVTAVTFTNQAAAEMRGRLSARLGKRAAAQMHIGTFHAVCRNLLDRRPLLGEEEAALLIADVLRRAGSKRAAMETKRWISAVKSGMASPIVGEEQAIFDDYCAACRRVGARDLDDLLLDALSLPGGGKQFRHLLVDEYQDINAVQRRLVAHWSRGGESLFVIGDPDQSIYGFRGASAACFSALQTEFPALQTVTLSKNYRSTPEIVQSAAAVIGHNPGGARRLESARPAGAPVRVLRAESAFSEAVFIAKEIASLAGGVDMLAARTAEAGRERLRAFSEIAVLCRTHRQLDLMESCLRHDDIPCIVSGREEALLDDAARGAAAFFRYVLHPEDTAALCACARYVYQGTAAQTERILCAAAAGNTDAECPPGLIAERETFAPLIRTEKPQLLLERWIAAHGEGDGQAAAHLRDMADFYADMPAFLDALTLGEEADLLRASGKVCDSGAVHLMTLHGAKGLEFPVVFLAGVSDGALPLRREHEPTDEDEERRLFFVGMTRAKEELIVSGSAPLSPFLSELPEDVIAGITEARPRTRTGRQLSLF